MGKATDTVVCDPYFRDQPLHTTFPLDYSFIHSLHLYLGTNFLTSGHHILNNLGYKFVVH